MNSGQTFNRALIFGGRDFRNRAFLFASLDLARTTFGFTEICHGNCGKLDEKTGTVIEGADMFAGLWALARGVKCRSFPANWPKFQNAAGMIRNVVMLDEFQPHIALGYPMGGPGSTNMKSLARGVGVPVWVPSDGGDWGAWSEPRKMNTIDIVWHQVGAADHGLLDLMA